MLLKIVGAILIFGAWFIYDKYLGGAKRQQTRMNDIHRSAVEQVYGKEEAERLYGKKN